MEFRQDWIGRRGRDHDRVVVDSLHCCDRRHRGSEVRSAGRPPFYAENDVLAGEERTVVERDTWAQVELPGRRRGQPPRDRERRLHLRAGVEVNQRLVDLKVRSDRRKVIDRVGIEGQRLGRARPAQHVLRNRRRGLPAGENNHQRADTCFKLLNHPGLSPQLASHQKKPSEIGTEWTGHERLRS
jgi:hypothetical protein